MKSCHVETVQSKMHNSPLSYDGSQEEDDKPTENKLSSWTVKSLPGPNKCGNTDDEDLDADDLVLRRKQLADVQLYVMIKRRERKIEKERRKLYEERRKLQYEERRRRQSEERRRRRIEARRRRRFEERRQRLDEERKESRNEERRRRLNAVRKQKRYGERRQRQNAERKRRRLWVRKWIVKRQGRGRLHHQESLTIIQNELRLQDADSYRYSLNMDENLFEEFLARISPRIQKQDTVMRQAIPPRQRLVATLRFLANADSYRDLSRSLSLPKCTVSLVIRDTLEAILDELQDECIKFPNSHGQWKEVEHHYRTLWNFPHCVGAIDGKHINFCSASAIGSSHRTYMSTDSIVLIALVDARYKFLFVHIGRNGRRNEASVFRDSDFGQLLLQGSIKFPEPEPLPEYNVDVKVPFFITGDDAFPLSTNLMKPYPERELTNEERIFNCRLSRTRRVVENTFGILANRFKILLTTIALPVQKVELITMVCCTLHNYILARKPVAIGDVEDEDPNISNNESKCPLRDLKSQEEESPAPAAKAVRDYLKEYFNSTGDGNPCLTNLCEKSSCTVISSPKEE